MDKIILRDNGGRRSGHDRRIFSYAAYFPEQRSGTGRRFGFDRRNKPRYALTPKKRGKIQAISHSKKQV